jgi:phosphate-selective porin OprO/OprP
MSRFKLLSLIALSLISISVFAQRERDERAMIHNFKGVQFKSPDSSFYINFRFRMQNRIGAYTTSGTDLSFNEYDARVRRLRMRLMALS